MFLSFSTIYFTSSRSKLGFLKELHLLLFGRWFNKRIINHLHGADFKSFYKSSGLLKPIVNYCYKGIEISIVLLSEMAKDYDDFPTMKTAIVTNCYPKEMDLFKNRVIKKNQIIYLSNLMYSKGILEFLDACSVLLKNDLTLEVKIAGSPLADIVMSLEDIKNAFNEKYELLRSQFSTRICYLGVVKGNEKSQLLFESTMFILPSYYPAEAFPISIIEAMRAGNAIVTTNHNFLPYIIKPENGIIIEPRSSEEIIRGVETLLKNKEVLQNIQQINIELAKQNFSQPRYIQEVQSIIMAI